MTEKIEVILVDIGSSFIKSVEIIEGEAVNRKQWESVEELKDNYQGHTWMISSVRKNLSYLEKLFEGEIAVILNHNTRLPISLDYKTPETLGPDRMALAVGANQLPSR